MLAAHKRSRDALAALLERWEQLFEQASGSDTAQRRLTPLFGWQQRGQTPSGSDPKTFSKQRLRARSAYGG